MNVLPFVIVCRPGHPGQSLVETLSQKGFNVAWGPLIHIEPIKSPRIENLDSVDGLIFTSRAAVQHFSEHKAVTQTPRIMLFAVGKSTATALAEYGHPSVTTPAPTKENSEGLLAIPALKAAKGKRLMVVKGEGGRTLLKKSLAKRGANVSCLDVYRREPIEFSQEVKNQLNQSTLLYCVITSVEILNQFHHYITQSHKDKKQCILFLASSRIEKKAKELSFPNLVLASPNNADLVEKISQCYYTSLNENTANEHESMTEKKPKLQAKDALSTSSHSEDSPSRAESTAVQSVSHSGALVYGLVGMTFVLVIIAIVFVFLAWQKMSEINIKNQQVVNQFSDLQRKVNNQVEHSDSLAQQLKRSFTDQLDSQINKLTTDIHRIDSSVKQFSETIEIQNNKVKQFGSDLDIVRKGLRTLSGEKQTQWIVNEAHYLVKLAHQNIYIMKDLQTGLALLELADERINRSGNLNLKYIRDALAKDIAATRRIPWVDSQHIIATIENIIPQINEMPLVSLNLPEDDSQNASQASEVTGWRNRLNRVLDEIKREWIVIRHHEQKVEALLTPKQYQNLQQNIILALQQAQIAAFKQYPDIYQANLSKAISWLNGFFQHNSEIAQKIAKSLDTLREKPVVQQVPTQLEALTLLSSFVANRPSVGDSVQ